MLTDSLVTAYSAIVNPDIDTALMVAVVISGLVIALYNVVTGITIGRTEAKENKYRRTSLVRN